MRISDWSSDVCSSDLARDPLFLHHHRQDADFRMTGLPVIGRMSPNAKTASLAALMALAMTGLGFAAVPLYDLFFRVTGFGGTTQRYDPVGAAAEPPILSDTLRKDESSGGKERVMTCSHRGSRCHQHNTTAQIHHTQFTTPKT